MFLRETAAQQLALPRKVSSALRFAVLDVQQSTGLLHPSYEARGIEVVETFVALAYGNRKHA